MTPHGLMSRGVLSCGSLAAWLAVVWLDVAVGARAGAKRTSVTSATPVPRH
jgi:hypothetical protein